MPNPTHNARAHAESRGAEYARSVLEDLACEPPQVLRRVALEMANTRPGDVGLDLIEGLGLRAAAQLLGVDAPGAEAELSDAMRGALDAYEAGYRTALLDWLRAHRAEVAP